MRSGCQTAGRRRETCLPVPGVTTRQDIMPDWNLGFLDLGGLRRLAGLISLYVRSGDLILLEGDLGAGKSTFARFLIRALAGDEAAEVPSPTFALVQSYETPRLPVHHFDLYRLSGPPEVR